MSFIYEGVNVDVVTPGYESASPALVRAFNMNNIANKKLAEIDSIVASYQAAHGAYAQALTYGNTLNTQSTDPAVRNAIAANQIQLSKLNPELAKWGKIVVANGGKFASGTAGNTGSPLDATPDFTAKRAKYAADINKNTQILTNAGPIMCTGLPPYDASQAAILNQARADNDVLLSAANAADASRENAYQLGLATDKSPKPARPKPPKPAPAPKPARPKPPKPTRPPKPARPKPPKPAK